MPTSDGRSIGNDQRNIYAKKEHQHFLWYTSVLIGLNLRVHGRKKPPVHGVHLAAVLDGASGQVGHVADVQVGLGACQVAQPVCMDKFRLGNVAEECSNLLVKYLLMLHGLLSLTTPKVIVILVRQW